MDVRGAVTGCRSPSNTRWLDQEADTHGSHFNFAILPPAPLEAGWLKEDQIRHVVTDINLGDKAGPPFDTLPVPIVGHISICYTFCPSKTRDRELGSEAGVDCYRWCYVDQLLRHPWQAACLHRTARQSVRGERPPEDRGRR